MRAARAPDGASSSPARPMTDWLGARREAIVQAAKDHGWRLVVLFGSSAFAGEGRDIDFAVMPRSRPGLLEQGAWLAEFESLFASRPVDLLILDEHTSPITRFEVLWRGRCLYEEVAGLFDRERDRAFFLYADSEHFRRAARERSDG